MLGLLTGAAAGIVEKTAREWFGRDIAARSSGSRNHGQMLHLLSKSSRPVLERLAAERTLCAFDFDGTLCPIAAHPLRARMRRRTRTLLDRTALLYPCVVVSGRARNDLVPRLDGIALARVIGNHGAETERTGTRARSYTRQWTAVLERELGAIPGLWVENKNLSVAVHYRQSPRKRETRCRILEVVRGLRRASVFEGKQIVNLAMEGLPHKGTAILAEQQRLGCKCVLFVGDDENDETAFALGGNVVAVRIGRAQRSHAPYYLRTQMEIDELLSQVCALRLRE